MTTGVLPQALPPHHPFRSAEARQRYLDDNDRRAAAWPRPCETRFVETSFGATFVRINGPAEAPPLVLLPAAATCSLVWTSHIEAFAKEHRTYALDNIYDVGRSVYVRPVTSVADAVNWLTEVLSGLDLASGVRLLGASYGAFIACHYALSHPERLACAVLLEPAGTILPLSRSFMVGAVLSALHPALTRRFGRWLFADSMQQGEETQRAAFALLDGVAQANRYYVPKKPVWPTVVSDEALTSLRVPMLYVVGENEKLASPTRAVARLHRLAPACQTVILPGAGHDMPVVAARPMQTAVVEFLRSVAEGRGATRQELPSATSQGSPRPPPPGWPGA